MSEQFRHLLPSDFDKYDCVKLSKVFYLSLFFLLRAYFAWVMSVTNMKDQVGIIQFLYPDPKLFYLNLFSGMFGLLLLVVLSLRKPDAPQWVKKIWPQSRAIIIMALLFDICVSFYGFQVISILPFNYFFAEVAICLLIIFLCFNSKKLSINLTEFPEPLPEK